MKRRELMLAALTAPALGLPLLARAHHGWGSFDQDRPIYLEGRVTRSKWQNPHAELELEVPAGLKVPASLVQRAIPAQTATVGEDFEYAVTATATDGDAMRLDCASAANARMAASDSICRD